MEVVSCSCQSIPIPRGFVVQWMFGYALGQRMNLIRIEYDGHVSTVLQDHCGSSMGIQGVHPHTATLSAACRLHFDPST
jgi:hypothetical protein